jgi:hypothetical protein
MKKNKSKYWDTADKPKQEEVNATPPPFDKPIKVNNPKQAKKLLSRLIYMLQIDKVESKKAKDLTYLLSVFISIVKETELEQRIADLENRMGGTSDG